MSPPNRSYDEVLKRSLYERSKVPEYWVVDPENKTIEVLVLEHDHFVRRALFTEEDTLASLAFDGRSQIALTKIFAPL